MVEQSFIPICSTKLDHLKSETGQKRFRYQSWCHFAFFTIFKRTLLELEKMQISVGGLFSVCFSFFQKCESAKPKFSTMDPASKSEIVENALFPLFCDFVTSPQPRATNRRRYRKFSILKKILQNKDFPIGTVRA